MYRLQMSRVGLFLKTSGLLVFGKKILEVLSH